MLIISEPGRERLGVGRKQHLEAEQRVERDVEEQSRQHRRDGRRTFGVRVGQPGMQRREADLGAIAEQQEHEGEIEQRTDRRRWHAPSTSVHTMELRPSPMAGWAAM